MKSAELKSLGKPDEVREFPKGRVEVVKMGGATVGRAVLQPGWRWSTCVQPVAKTKSCEAAHLHYINISIRKLAAARSPNLKACNPHPLPALQLYPRSCSALQDTFPFAGEGENTTLLKM